MIPCKCDDREHDIPVNKYQDFSYSMLESINDNNIVKRPTKDTKRDLVDRR